MHSIRDRFTTLLPAALISSLFCASALSGQNGMQMPEMENSVGFLSSGTSLQPKAASESAPMIHTALGGWTFMFHANAFVVDTQQSGPRGGDKFYSTNWAMPMLSRTVGRQTVSLRGMLSLDPLTITKRRYPEMFQTGETAFGQPIVDGQHPHDLFMEIAGRYDFRFNETAGVFVYGGPLGEPALGPTAFPHRASASENPVAVLAHHQQDSTHISSSVITAGVSAGPVQLEASTFHGREPDENRWNIDGGKPDSFASRLTLAAGKQFTGQFSIGRLNDREVLEPGMDTIRMTASLHHAVRVGAGSVATSLIWGRNKDVQHVAGKERRVSNAYTFETTANFLVDNWIWTRIENVDRDASLLPAAVEIGHAHGETVGRVQAYTVGYARELPLTASPVRIALGAQLSFYALPFILKPLYDFRPSGASVFLRIRPAGNVAGHMQMMHEQHQH